MKTYLGAIDLGSRTFSVFALPNSADGIKTAMFGWCSTKRIEEYVADFGGVHPRLLGQVDFELQYIAVSATSGAGPFAETLYHEIGHAVAWVLGDPCNNEALAAFYSHFVRQLVPGLNKVAETMLPSQEELASLIKDASLDKTK